jgi:hypothetical protein
MIVIMYSDTENVLENILTPKGPRVFWYKTTQNYLLLKKEPVILF